MRDDKATRRTHLSEVVDWYKEKIGLAMDARREDGRVAGTAAGLTKPFINMVRLGVLIFSLLTHGSV